MWLDTQTQVWLWKFATRRFIGRRPAARQTESDHEYSMDCENCVFDTVLPQDSGTGCSLCLDLGSLPLIPFKFSHKYQGRSSELPHLNYKCPFSAKLINLFTLSVAHHFLSHHIMFLCFMSIVDFPHWNISCMLAYVMAHFSRVQLFATLWTVTH